MALTPAKLTSNDLRTGMLKRWCAPEWAIMWEVGRATGAVSRQRYADAVMMSLWPSRGLELHGVEIKVSRSDWKREAMDPTKAEAIADYCDRWWVHTPPGVVADLSEMPPAWGLRTFDGRQWKTIREAEKTPAKACDRQFLASLLRRADEYGREDVRRVAAEMTETIKRNAQTQMDVEIERRSKANDTARKTLDKLEEVLGFKFINNYEYFGKEPEKIGALIKLIIAAGLEDSYAGIMAVRNAADTTVKRMDRVLLESPFNQGPTDGRN